MAVVSNTGHGEREHVRCIQGVQWAAKVKQPVLYCKEQPQVEVERGSNGLIILGVWGGGGGGGGREGGSVNIINS